MTTSRVLLFRPYPLKAGDKIHIEEGPRSGDWEVLAASEKTLTLRCPVSQRRFEWNRFCYFVEERDQAQWPSQG